MLLEEFHYKIPWRSKGAHSGHHQSTQVGGGFEFRGYAPLISAPDARRFDVRASLRDPYEGILVRIYNQRSAVPVYAVADLSASMGFAGCCRKLDVLADFIVALGYSAYRTGDPFGFIACETCVCEDLTQSLTRMKGAGVALGERLRALTPTARHSRALLDAAHWLTRERSLVFLVSDFHFGLDLLDRVLGTLTPHAVVPVVLVDSTELENPPRFGIARVVDAETGKSRTLLLRPSLRARMRRAFVERKEQLTRLFIAHNTAPLFIYDRFDPDAVTRYFYA
jgi:Uncharacterized conserved protein (some members contain a von Willebrand factor type A (vWA) domain)